MIPGRPVGPPVRSGAATGRVPDTIPGRHVSLRRPQPAADAAVLFRATHGTEEAEAVWAYMGYGPWPDEASMREWMAGVSASPDPRWYTVADAGGDPLGMAAYLNHSAADRRIEIGHLWYVPGAQRTTANTEVILLMGEHAFGALGCRRLEWKCDALNARSREAAERLGFSFEGIFRSHMIVKGRNRDTAWYSIIDTEWPLVSAALRTWLYEEARDDGGRPRRGLMEIRDALAGS